jgi:hypothetical protein
MLGNANSKFRMYADRYILVKQRMMRSTFLNQILAGTGNKKYVSIECVVVGSCLVRD